MGALSPEKKAALALYPEGGSAAVLVAAPDWNQEAIAKAVHFRGIKRNAGWRGKGRRSADNNEHERRRCLSCDADFPSAGFGNRRCNQCTKKMRGAASEIAVESYLPTFRRGHAGAP